MSKEPVRVSIWELMQLQTLAAFAVVWFRFVVPVLEAWSDQYRGYLYFWPPWVWIRSWFGY